VCFSPLPFSTLPQKTIPVFLPFTVLSQDKTLHALLAFCKFDKNLFAPPGYRTLSGDPAVISAAIISEAASIFLVG
jgi:hypothetical protein